MGLTRTAKARFSSLTAAAVFVATALASTPASAEAVSATGKGITGGVLLGAELAMIPQALAGVDKWWAYALGGGLGAAAGGVGGYFVETEVSTAEPSLYMLAGGMALVIPAVVLTLNATAYKPEVEEGEMASDDTTSDVLTEPTGDAPAEAPPVEAAPEKAPAPSPVPAAPPPSGPQARRSKKSAPSRASIMPGLFGVDLTGPRISLVPGVPTVDVQPLYTAREVSQYGGAAGHQVMFPAFAGRF
ncbi:MAG: hypothetical protein FJ104_12745 [Deltaproteobacteria bacterium]|nr:hypothetical protein [Deltaproteobacteria bacterium]